MLHFRTRVEKARTFRRTQPFMKIAAVKIGAKRIELKRDLTRAMRTIYDRENACLTRTTDNFFDREDDGR